MVDEEPEAAAAEPVLDADEGAAADDWTELAADEAEAAPEAAGATAELAAAAAEVRGPRVDSGAAVVAGAAAAPPILSRSGTRVSGDIRAPSVAAGTALTQSEHFGGSWWLRAEVS